MLRNLRPVWRICRQDLRRYSQNSPADRIRNIGILAHIDAGKTTTTERMLFYAGITRQLGEVHHGNTVTDCLAQERERGITICSSAVSFRWKEHRINLIDTPGHIDFTMEVEQSLGAVDGTVVILDASAGVEAQTITVWNQIDRYKIPRLVFVNKMDRPDAEFERCVHDVQKKLGAKPVALEWPLHDGKTLKGIIDLVRLKKLVWNAADQGRSYQLASLDGAELKLGEDKRVELIDTLSGMDDELAEYIISNDTLENVAPDLLQRAVRKATVSQKLVPVLLGSAYKNIGVQPLIDSVIQYLPAPSERNEIYDCFGDDFVGKVFKVTHDKQRGALSLVRVFRGELKAKGTRITTASGTSETVQRLYEPLADEYREVNECCAGNIVVCGGLKNTATGDLLVNSVTSLKNAQKKLSKKIGGQETTHSDDDEPGLVDDVLALLPKIPDAVYFCSIEPPSISYQSALEVALRQIQREDPSLRVRYDETTAQTVLGGMGELHLEIIKSRLLTEYKIDADLGPLQIAYRETLLQPARGGFAVQKEIAGSKQSIAVEMSLEPRRQDKDVFRLDNSPEASEILKPIRPRLIQLVRKGAMSAMERGPKLGGEVMDVAVVLHSLAIGRGTADSFIMSGAAQCVQKILLDANCNLLEPIMRLEIVVTTDRTSQVLGDLSRRRATVIDVSPRGDQSKVILVDAPLAELSGYSSVVRTISSGSASMSMQPNGYSAMSMHEEAAAIRRAQGLE